MTFPLPALFALTLLTAALDWLAIARGWRRVEVISRPAVMVLLFLWVYFSSGLQGEMLYFGVGLILSLVGDILLMREGQGPFLAGMAAFLLAQVAYVIGFNLSAPGTDLFGILTAILVAILMARLYRKATADLIASGQGRLRLPVLAYTFALALMLLSALLTLFRTDWLPVASLLAALGAALFLTSNVLLARSKFPAPPQGDSPVRSDRLRITILYHLGQMLLMGVTLNYAGGTSRRFVWGASGRVVVLRFQPAKPSPRASCAAPMTMNASGSASWTIRLSVCTSERLTTQ
jgi:uncharacterized membrane protein YhhN